MMCSTNRSSSTRFTPKTKLRRKLLPCALIGFIATLSVGCASIFNGKLDTVEFTSQPTGASIDIITPENEVIHTGTTPFSVTLERGRGFFKAADLTARASHPTAGARELPIKSSIAPWYWGNILLGGLPGMLIVDPLTGAMYNFPETIDINLNEPQPQS